MSENSNLIDKKLRNELGDSADVVMDPAQQSKPIKQINQRQKHKEEKKLHKVKMLSNSKQKELRKAELRRETIEKSKRRNEMIANFKHQKVSEELKGIIEKTSLIGTTKSDNQKYKEALENKERGLPFDQEIIDKINKKKEKVKKVVEIPLVVAPAQQETKNDKPIEPAKPSKPLIDPTKKPKAKVEEKKPVVVEEEEDPSLTKAINVQLNRPEGVQEARLKLPALDKEAEILEIINDPRGRAARDPDAKINDVLIIQGSTGSGKTTQVPQFLYEAGYSTLRTKGRIAITEPRRIAAISMSKRVAYEMGFNLGQEVGYLIRYQQQISDATKIKFLTDGVLLRELESDMLLTQYSVIIIDEAHERTVNTDVLIGMLANIIRVRRKKHNENPAIEPLKLIIMSATLNTDDFANANLFGYVPPIINVEGKMFPVMPHFAQITPKLEDVNEEIKKLVEQLHEYLGDGTMLVFLPGKKDIEECVRYFQKKYKNVKAIEKSDKKKKTDVKKEEEKKQEEKKADDEESDLQKIEELDEALRSEIPVANKKPMLVLPLYSVLSPQEQAKVFEPPPEGTRLVIFSTNVAETSLTIPGVKFVVDSGLEKQRVYNFTSGFVEQKVAYISQASAEQRMGRAGRTSEGICFRLYSSGVYEHAFKKNSDPEILTRPADEIILLLKSMGVDNIERFPLPKPFTKEAIERATAILKHLSAINEKTEKILPYGRALSAFPLAPRLAKILILAWKNQIIDYATIIVAALSVRDPYEKIMKEMTDEENENKHLSKAKHGDVIRILTCFLQWQRGDENSRPVICAELGLREKAMQEMQDIRVQLAKILSKVEMDDAKTGKKVKIMIDTTPLNNPTEVEIVRLRQAILGGFPENVARHIKDTNYYEIINGGERKPAIHGRSVLAEIKPLYIVYTEIVEDEGRLRFLNATPVEPSWLMYAGSPMLLRKESPTDTEYDQKADRVFCKISGNYYNWRIENVPFPSEDPYRFFAGALLRGLVFDELREFVPEISRKLISDLVEKNGARAVPQRNMSIVVVLKKNNIATKKDMIRMLKQNTRFLLTEYLYWVDDSSFHKRIQIVWEQKLPFSK